MSQQESQSEDRLDVRTAEDRKIAVNLIRRTAEERHPKDWHNRCGYVATYGVDILNQLAGTGYRIAAGRVEDLTEWAPKVLWDGSYTGEGFSPFHVWIEGPSGEKIDCSRVPSGFGGDFLWEPYTTLPALRYTEIPETTRKVDEALAKARARTEGGGEAGRERLGSSLRRIESMVLQSFTVVRQAREALATEIVETTKSRIDSRPVGPRNQGADDTMFSPANDGIMLSVRNQDPAMARAIFSECYSHALKYEGDYKCQIHKGSITFNVGLAHLQSQDYTSAMHYFELSQEETRLTTGHKTWSIYLNQGLFDVNFWNTIDEAEKNCPLSIHADLWGKPYSKDAGKKAWRKLSGYSKLQYIVAVARRIHLRQLETASGWGQSDSIRVGYWNLIADLSRLLETEVNRRADVAANVWKLYELVTQGFTATQRGNISTLVAGYISARNTNDTQKFNTHYPTIRDGIKDTNLTKLERIAHAVHLLYATRNQVQHHIDRRLILYKDPEEAKFTVDVLLSLCRLSSWAKKA